MSDQLVRLIPSDPYFRVTERQAQEALRLIRQSIRADGIELRMQETPMFIDSRENMTSISCPCCRQLLDFGWWGDAMDKAYETDFMDLSVQLPCCGAKSTLQDLIYDFPCAFASFELEVRNPESDRRPDARKPEDMLKQLEELLGIPMRVIYAYC